MRVVILLIFVFLSISFAEVHKTKNRFLGYRKWKDAQAKMVFHSVEQDGNDRWQLTTEFSCPGATSYLLSDSSDLSRGEWIKMSSPVIRKKLRVLVHKREELIVLWIVFKRKSLEGKQFEVSVPLGTVRHKKKPHRKIQLIKNGYIDWGSYQIYARGKSVKFKDEYSRYGLGAAQNGAQEAMSLEIQKIIRAVSLDHVNRVQDYFYSIFSVEKKREFFDIFSILPNYVYYPDKYTAVAMGNISLVEEFPFFFQISHESLPIPQKVTSIVEGPVTGYDRIYVDVKGFSFSPCIFPELVGPDGKIICNRSLYKAETPYVRYLQEPDGIKDITYAYVKAKIVSAESPSKIVIQDHSNVTTADWQNAVNQGSLYFLVD